MKTKKSKTKKLAPQPPPRQHGSRSSDSTSPLALSASMVPGRRHIALIDGYLKLLSWTQQELAKQADISAPQLHGILNQDRPLTRGILAAIAWAIAEGVDELKTDDEDAGRRRAKSLGVGFYGRRELEVLLAELLKSAGFSSKGRPERNLVWDRVGELEQALQRVDSTGAVTKPTEHPKLRVGWFDWAPINALDHDEGVPLTLWQDIVECVCALLHVEPEYIRIEADDLALQIASRAVDVAIPLVKLPIRTPYVQFSRCLPGLSVGMNALVRTSHLSIARRKPHTSDKTAPPRGDVGAWKEGVDAVHWGELEIGCMHGGIAEAMLWEVEHRIKGPEKAVIRGRRHVRSVRSGAAWLLEQDEFRDAESTLPVRCFFADALSCEVAVLDSGKQSKVPKLSKLFGDHEPLTRYSRLPLAMALHPDEPKLLSALNTALDVMEETGICERLLAESRSVKQNLPLINLLCAV